MTDKFYILYCCESHRIDNCSIAVAEDGSACVFFGRNRYRNFPSEDAARKFAAKRGCTLTKAEFDTAFAERRGKSK